MPHTITIMTELQAIDRLNSVIESKLNKHVTDDEVAEIYNIISSGNGFIATSPSNKRYLITNSSSRVTFPTQVLVRKYELIRDLTPRTYKNSAMLDDKTGYVYKIDSTCKKKIQKAT